MSLSTWSLFGRHFFLQKHLIPYQNKTLICPQKPPSIDKLCYTQTKRVPKKNPQNVQQTPKKYITIAQPQNVSNPPQGGEGKHRGGGGNGGIDMIRILTNPREVVTHKA